jgi:hypothetical protein
VTFIRTARKDFSTDGKRGSGYSMPRAADMRRLADDAVPLRGGRRYFFERNGNKEQVPRCRIKGCPEGRSLGKLECEEHVLESAMGRAITGHLAWRSAEVARANRGEWEGLDPRGSVAEDVLVRARVGKSSVGKLHHFLRTEGLTLVGVRSFSRKLEEAGLVERFSFKGRRGSIMEGVVVTEAGAEAP